MTYILIVLFVHRGLLIDRSNLFVDRHNYSSYEACAAKAEEYRAAYRDYQQSVCRSVRLTRAK